MVQWVKGLRYKGGDLQLDPGTPQKPAAVVCNCNPSIPVGSGEVEVGRQVEG